MTRCEVTLWLLGIGLISAFAMLRAVASAQRLAGVAQFQEQQQPTQSASAIMNSGELPGSASAASVAVTTPHFGVLAILRIARINLEVPVKQGTDHRSLSGGAGSIEGTAKPGSAGNIGIAAHRDTFFRGLEQLVLGDLIQIETILGTRSYRVARLFVVEPVDVQVLANTGVDQLTLVTCYPFHYIGHAPQRYIVRADEEIIVQIPAINHNNQSQPKLTEDV